MRRLKLQFILFFLLFALALGFLLFNSYRQMAIEERSIWEGASERVYNQMQAAISEFLNGEDARSFSEYRYYQVVSDKVPADGLSISPLAAMHVESDGKGLIGYFQIDPDGSFSTPYLPAGESAFSPEERERRRNREREIERLTQSLKSEVYAEAKGRAAEPKVGYKDGLVKAEKPATRDKAVTGSLNRPLKVVAGDAKNIYPNPIQKKADFAKKKQADFEKDEAGGGGGSELEQGQLSRRVLAPSVVQSEAFEKQAALPPEAPAGPAPVANARTDIALDDVKKAVEPSLMIDPFQARLVLEKYLIFYRKIWLNEKMYFQGFIVELDPFFTWAMEQSFANSDLIGFAKALLNFGPEVLANFGPADLQGQGSPIFQRALGYPLNRFDLTILAASLPRLSARLYLNVLAGLLVILATFGLYLIYRTAASQVYLSQKRQDFVSAVTHELKTPLTSIRMYSEMLADGWVKEPQKQQEYYRHLSKESSRLSSLIENVLQLARLEKQTYKIQLKEASPLEDFDTWLAELKQIAQTRSYQIHAERPETLPPIRYDPEALQQVLLILLDNSMKFTAEKDLELKLFSEGDALVLEWGDRGPGIPSAELHKVFEKFYRVENELTRKTQGTGIGLAMAKIIVESMGAKIEARNRDGGGLSVRIRFQTLPA